MSLDRFLVAGVVVGALLVGCGGDKSTSMSFTSLRGELGAQTIGFIRPGDPVPCDRRVEGCGNPLAIARSKEEVVKWMTDLPEGEIKVDFERQMVVIMNGLNGTTLQFTVDSVVRDNDEIVVNTTLCHVRDVVVFNFQTRVGVAIETSNDSVVVRSRNVWDVDNTIQNIQNFPVERCKRGA